MKTLYLLLLLPVACTGTRSKPPAAVHLLIDGDEVTVRDPQVLSVDDANERFQVSFATDADLDHAKTMVLMIGEDSLRPSGWGRNGDQGFQMTVPATAAQARAFAAALGVPARDRAPWQGRLTGKLEAAGTFAVGAERMPLRFELTNDGQAPVWLMDGGRGRNALGRDNRFTFEVERDGERLPARTVHDFGGLGVYRRILPGGTWTLEPDLAHWFTFDRPGKYTVRAIYEAEQMPFDYEPGKALPMGFHAHLQHTEPVPAELVLTVR